MSLRQQAVALATLSRKEYHRVVRIWLQTVLPPAINMGLYFLIFGELIGALAAEHQAEQLAALSEETA